MNLTEIKKELKKYLDECFLPYQKNGVLKSWESYQSEKGSIVERPTVMLSTVAELIEKYRPINVLTNKKIKDTEIKKCTGVDVDVLKNRVSVFSNYDKEAISKLCLCFGLKKVKANRLFAAARITIKPSQNINDAVISFFIKEGKYYSLDFTENVKIYAECLVEAKKYAASKGVFVGE